MSCNLSALVRTNNCNYTPAGVNDRIYIFDVDSIDLEKRAPGDDGCYKADIFTNVQLYAIDIKPDSGQVTSEKSEDGESRSLVATAIVDHNIRQFLAIDAAIAFNNVGVIVPFSSTEAYVIMSPYRHTKYSSNYDSGTTYDSDHGFTITFTCAPVLYACPMMAFGKLLSSSNSNLNTGSSGSSTCTVDSLTPSNGTLTITVGGNNVSSVLKGTSVKLTAMPDAGYKCTAIKANEQLIAGGGNVDSELTTTAVVTSNTQFSATFEKE